MIIDCVSDTHGEFPVLDGGDLLIVAGDLTGSDKAVQVVQFFIWLDKQNYRKKIVIAGNHDNILQQTPALNESLPDNISYLCDSGTEIEFEHSCSFCSTREEKEKCSWEHICNPPFLKRKLKIWGSPWTRRFEGMNPHCMAFTVDTDEELAEKWALIPDDIDILVTHSPPYQVLDKTRSGEHVGSKSLALQIGTRRNPPKLWVWGHIHEGYGIDKPIRGKPCTMVNASIMNEDYEAVNKPIRVEI